MAVTTIHIERFGGSLGWSNNCRWWVEVYRKNAVGWQVKLYL